MSAPSIDWSHVTSRFNYLVCVQDPIDGSTYGILSSEYPEIQKREGYNILVSCGQQIYADLYTSFCLGTPYVVVERPTSEPLGTKNER